MNWVKCCRKILDKMRTTVWTIPKRISLMITHFMIKKKKKNYFVSINHFKITHLLYLLLYHHHLFQLSTLYYTYDDEQHSCLKQCLKKDQG